MQSETIVKQTENIMDLIKIIVLFQWIKKDLRWLILTAELSLIIVTIPSVILIYNILIGQQLLVCLEVVPQNSSPIVHSHRCWSFLSGLGDF